MPLNVAAILLAAGQSRRMGTQKLLLPYAGRTVISHIAAQLLQSAVQQVLAVVGTDRQRISDALSDAPVTLVSNDDPNADMLSSVRCGLRACPQTCDAILVTLGDQPSITPQLINQIIAAFDPAKHSIVVPTHAGQRGHPILFAAKHREEILTSLDNIGLRGLLKTHPSEVVEIESESAAIFADIDLPVDYIAELARLKN